MAATHLQDSGTILNSELLLLFTVFTSLAEWKHVKWYFNKVSNYFLALVLLFSFYLCPNWWTFSALFKWKTKSTPQINYSNQTPDFLSIVWLSMDSGWWLQTLRKRKGNFSWAVLTWSVTMAEYLHLFFRVAKNLTDNPPKWAPNMKDAAFSYLAIIRSALWCLAAN